jgi:chitosanase
MLNPLQKQSVQAIVNIFETGKVRGEYGQVTLLKGDSGNLTYGRSQTTLSSGNLHLLIKAYCEAPNAAFAPPLQPYLSRLQLVDLSLNDDGRLKDLLRAAGDDPVMVETQDRFFDRVYWEPAEKSAAFIGSETALGMAAIYDSRIHGSWHAMRDRTNARAGTLKSIGEQNWMQSYVKVRKDWLANASALLRKTVYRMDALGALMGAGQWALDLPFHVRGVAIDAAALSHEAPVRASAELVETRLLRLRQPFMQGEDVRALQAALAGRDVPVETDGIFGPATEDAVRRFQQRSKMTADGIAGPATLAALGIGV